MYYYFSNISIEIVKYKKHFLSHSQFLFLFFSVLLSLILSGYSLNVISIHFEVKDDSNVAKSVTSLNFVASVFQNTL